jgi:SPP1 family predicted phage head-tail adaptor
LQVEAPDGQGGSARGWADVGALWARIEPVTVRSEEVAASRTQRITHRVTIRWRDGIAPAMRFIRRGRVLAIRAVHDPDESGRYLICLCEETGT